MKTRTTVYYVRIVKNNSAINASSHQKNKNEKKKQTITKFNQTTVTNEFR